MQLCVIESVSAITNVSCCVWPAYETGPYIKVEPGSVRASLPPAVQAQYIESLKKKSPRSATSAKTAARHPNPSCCGRLATASDGETESTRPYGARNSRLSTGHAAGAATSSNPTDYLNRLAPPSSTTGRRRPIPWKRVSFVFTVGRESWYERPAKAAPCIGSSTRSAVRSA